MTLNPAAVLQPASRILALSLFALLAACSGNDKPVNDTPVADTPKPSVPQTQTQVAFMPDIHFHDVYATFQDGSFKGVPNAKAGRNATIRQLQAQMTSTRLFNENYFAFIAALDDAVAR